MLELFIVSLGVIPLFTSRAFMPIFAAALYARHGIALDWVPSPAYPEMLGELPNWSGEPEALITLGGLAALEWLSQENPELRMWLEPCDPWIKSMAAFGVCF